MNKKYEYILEGLDCANCANKIEAAIKSIKDYEEVIVNFNTSKLSFETNIKNPKKKIEKIIHSLEPNVVVSNNNEIKEFNINYRNIIRLIFGIVIGLVGIFININPLIKTILIISSYIILLSKTSIKAIKILSRSKQLDENILITISVIGAYLVGEPFEGLMVIILYEIGKTLEEMAVNKSKKSVKELMNIKPEYANKLENKKIIKTIPENINVGETIIVKVGEKIPLDGIITKGITLLDISSLTGESVPIEKGIKDEALSGSINLSEVIEIKVTKEYKESTVKRILDLVEHATNYKTKTENFVSKAAKIYTPIVMILSLLTIILLPILSNFTLQESIYRALVFLVISCPCAIVISVPLSYFSGIGKSSKEGILIKGSDYLDQLRFIKTICFDKTGTLTAGIFEVASVTTKNISKEELIRLCAYGESYSNHPIAKAIVKHYNNEIDSKLVTNFKEIAGKGISFEIENKKIVIEAKEKSKEEQTTLSIKLDKKEVGTIVLKDQIKPNTKKIINEIHKRGIKTLMFTGDNEKTAFEVAKEIGIDEVYANLLPDSKFLKLKDILNKTDGTVAFIGDGINDAPSLMLADIGISMGNIGSASAIEASNIVLMNDDLEKIIKAIDISKQTSNIIKQNLIFSLGTKLLFVILNLFAITTMSWAVFADVGITIFAILNSIRILKK